MCHSGGGGGGSSHVGKKSWKCISEVDASLVFELYGDKNIFAPVEVEVKVGGAGCVWMKGGCESLRVSGPFARLYPAEAANSHFEKGVAGRCDKRC